MQFYAFLSIIILNLITRQFTSIGPNFEQLQNFIVLFTLPFLSFYYESHLKLLIQCLSFQLDYKLQEFERSLVPQSTCSDKHRVWHI